ncbi:hypothetical protein HNV12_25565 [Methanococcoides sp. SA1]|nr:hypothetical protein [Methanococcoides sp. SA1]
MEKQRTLSLRRILSRDGSSFAAVLISLLCWGFYLVENYFGYLIIRGRGAILASESDIQFSLNVAIVVTGVGMVFLIWRLLFFRALYNRGVETTGYVSLEYISKQRIEYKYTYQNIDYWRGNALTDRKYRKNYHEGDEVVLLVDP